MKSSLFSVGKKGSAGSCSLFNILKEAVYQLESAGIENPRMEAEILLAHFLKISRIELYTRWNEECPHFRDFQTLVTRRARHEPSAYIVGEREFWSLDFIVAPGVLIPRPETEFVVEAVLRFSPGAALIIDVGTGSGNIAVCLAKEIPTARIFALDISEAALSVARQNAARHRVSGQITFLRADLLSAFAQYLPFRKIDCVASNLPYIPPSDIPFLSPEVCTFEPQGALDGGGADGLDCYRRLIHETRGILKVGGLLIMEMGSGQKEALVREVHNHGYEVQEILSDYAGIDRILVARLSGC
ncbi:MAG: peptide chain release factor N(5)-glutamine methyltransferase [bacterium]